MSYGEFLAAVQEHGGYADRKEAERITDAVLTQLGNRLQSDSAAHLAAQLPAGLDSALSRSMDSAQHWGVSEFLERVAEATGAGDTETAESQVRAVLAVLADTVTGGELNKLISQLPSAYAALFGHPELA